MKFRIVILAAGKGKRMKSELPKTLTPVNGKPILGYLLDAVKESGLDPKPVVVVGHGREHICDAFGAACEYAVQEEQLGTGHAVRMAKDAVGDADTVIVLYGDHPFISAETIKRLADTHAESKGVITMMTVTVPDFEGWRAVFKGWSRVLRDGDGEVVGDVQVKDASEEQLKIHELNPCFLCFKAEWLWPKLEGLKNENAQGEYYLTDLVAAACAEGQDIMTIPVSPEEAVGINSPEERDLAERLTSARV